MAAVANHPVDLESQAKLQSQSEDRFSEPSEGSYINRNGGNSSGSLAAENEKKDEEEDENATVGTEQQRQNNGVATSPSPPGPGPGPVPDGGTLAWLQVLGAWSLFFNTWGIMNTFGAYQTFYESGQLFQEDSSTIAWIGASESFIVLLIGAVVGPIYDHGYLRSLLIIGTFLVVFGHMMLSLCHEYWQVWLAQGLVLGLGGGCLFVPAVAIMPQYFKTKIGLVIGISASGSSIGGIVYPIIFYRMVAQVGFPWAVRTMGFVALATLVIPIAVMKMRVKPPKAREIVDLSAFTDLSFMIFTLGGMVGFIGLFVGFYYIAFYGQSSGYTDTSLSFYLVPILNAGSFFGRTIPNWAADKIGPINVIAPGGAIVGIVLLTMLAVRNAAGMVLESLFFGVFSGVFVALPPVAFVALTKDKSKVGTRIGMGFAIIGLGGLLGGPGGGGVLGTDAANLNWQGLWIYGGVCGLGSAAILLVVKFMLGKGNFFAKV